MASCSHHCLKAVHPEGTPWLQWLNQLCHCNRRGNHVVPSMLWFPANTSTLRPVSHFVIGHGIRSRVQRQDVNHLNQSFSRFFCSRRRAAHDAFERTTLRTALVTLSQGHETGRPPDNPYRQERMQYGGVSYQYDVSLRNRHFLLPPRYSEGARWSCKVHLAPKFSPACRKKITRANVCAQCTL